MVLRIVLRPLSSGTVYRLLLGIRLCRMQTSLGQCFCVNPAFKYNLQTQIVNVWWTGVL